MRLVREAADEAGPVRAVFHLWSLGDLDEAAQLALGLHTVLALSQALAGGEVPITVVTDGVADVHGDEPLAPAKAAMLGACTVIGQEHPGLACRVVDVHGQVARAQACAAALLAEHAWPAPHGVVAYRGAQRWLRRYEPVRRDAPAQPRLRTGGVYLITGGLGGVGLVAARHLARRHGARLALMSRTAPPPREQWQPLADAPDTPRALRERLGALVELSALGAEVLLLQADVADAAAVQHAVAQVQARWGALHGVIHAAGLPGGGLIASRQRADVEAVFAPKLAGARHVLDAVRPLAPDFVLLCSSLTAIVGAYGQSDYAAANACLDALALAATRTGGPWVLSVNWDTWRDVGLAASQTLDDALGIRPAQGVDVLERLLAGPAVPQVVVSTVPLAEQVANAQSTRFAERLLPADALPKAPSALRRRPVLSTPYAPPATPLACDLAASWEQFLGISPIGVEDNLFELGGDSLIAIQLIARLHKTYGVEVHPADFFKTPTVADLATLIEIRLIEQIEQATPSPQAAAAALP